MLAGGAVGLRLEGLLLMVGLGGGVAGRVYGLGVLAGVRGTGRAGMHSNIIRLLGWMGELKIGYSDDVEEEKSGGFI